MTKDWDFTILSGPRNNPEYPFGLRRHRCFPNDRLYYYAILIDLVIRFSWLSKFIPLLTWLTDRECGIFVLVSFEVARRWMWIFFRVEAEWGESCQFCSFRLVALCPFRFSMHDISRRPFNVVFSDFWVALFTNKLRSHSKDTSRSSPRRPSSWRNQW